MAEVKTYKCDICGQVYHVDESVERRVMDLADITNGEKSREVKHYEHICDECAVQIRTVIKDPNAIKNLRKSNYENERVKIKYSDLLLRIFGKIADEPQVYYYFCDYEHKTDAAIIKLGELKKSRDNWKCAASWGIATSLAFMISFIIQLFA